jgi:hypothetical protein
VVTNVQLYFAIGIPILFNATILGVLIALINAKFSAVDAKFEAINTKFDAINQRLDGIDQRFDDMRDLWRAELRRVEEVLDARLKHLEQRH